MLTVDESVEREHVAALRRVKEQRGDADVQRSLDAVRRAAASKHNLLPPLLNAARARTTVGEVMNSLADVFGLFQVSVV